MSGLYIGLISGTSCDGIDASLVDFGGNRLREMAFCCRPYPSEIRTELNRLCQPGQQLLLTEYGRLDTRLGELFAETAQALLAEAGVTPEQVRAIGSHGQTIYHAPQPPDRFTLQIADPNIIAERTGIATVADFRRRDLAVGGEGAPLVPAFHRAAFFADNQPRTIVNIGGIANITVLNQTVRGFDTGPGNTLLDFWHQRHRQQPYDHAGEWAASGRPHAELLRTLLDDAYFRLPPPKSTGREYFSAQWLLEKLENFPDVAAADVQATLCRLSADSIAAAIRDHAPDSKQVLVCGGGAHNSQLMRLLSDNLGCPVQTTAAMGIHPDHVEACAFAWLARQTLNNLPGNLCTVTGAGAPAVLGGIYPGRAGF